MTKTIQKSLFILFTGVILGWIISTCVGSSHSRESHPEERDTTRIITTDVLTAHTPQAENTVFTGSEIHRLPISKTTSGKIGGLPYVKKVTPVNEIKDSTIFYLGCGAGGEPRQRPDSVAVEIPITQKHYRDSTYEAWVSGYAQNLDSIKVYRRTETITIREYKPPNRWHLGITAGYGYTPGGFKPYIGIGISYSLFSWK